MIIDYWTNQKYRKRRIFSVKLAQWVLQRYLRQKWLDQLDYQWLHGAIPQWPECAAGHCGWGPEQWGVRDLEFYHLEVRNVLVSVEKSLYFLGAAQEIDVGL
jgi:hypothetical protein